MYQKCVCGRGSKGTGRPGRVGEEREGGKGKGKGREGKGKGKGEGKGIGHDGTTYFPPLRALMLAEANT